MPPMSGPFTILKQISPVNNEIDKPQSNLGKTTMVIHSSKLRPYYPKEGFELKLTKSKIPTLEKKQTNKWHLSQDTWSLVVVLMTGKTLQVELVDACDFCLATAACRLEDGCVVRPKVGNFSPAYFVGFSAVSLGGRLIGRFVGLAADFSPTNQRIAHDLRKYGIQFTYRSTSTTGHILRNPITKPGVKHDVQHKSNAIYSVACNDCESVYVGETGRKIENRIKEHKYNIRSKDPRSLLYQHTLNTGHSFDLDNPICHYNNIKYKGERLILESLVSGCKDSINRRIDVPEQFRCLFKRV
ncbi:hypothetical protein LAZ67_10001503 [Cordylochernes scorpioides]|uniref:GIY-YIG domain-containing protein n=1 Tax=Cordylochernes scorpioides TaxID=51811 RepID=A0ABY6KVW5_9ARAC|nr:hypothetical protein LAZ67_10001503 [Cordylochernes scorpioides]